MSLNNLVQYNSCLNNKNRILDLIMSSTSIIHIAESSDPLSIVDPLHPPIEFCVQIDHEKMLKTHDEARFRFHKADYEKINIDLNKIAWEKELAYCSGVDEMVTRFYKILKIIIAKHVPKSKPRSNKYPVWFSAALVKVINEKLKYRIKYRKYRNPRDSLTFELLRERCTKLLNVCYKLYLKRLESSLASNPKLIWSFIKHKKGRNSSYPAQMSLGNEVATSGSDICELFASQFSSVYSTDKLPIPDQSYLAPGNNYLTTILVTKDQVFRVLKRLDPTKGAGSDGIPSIFAKKCAGALALPLCIIINKSLSSGIFPLAWKRALVIPLFKSGDTTVVKNYRPISILPTFAKTFESLLCPIISSHFQHLITPEQHGFIKARSTLTNLVSFVEDLAAGVDRGRSYDAIYTDFSKAFDRVSHEMLLHKLSSIGIAGMFLKWCKSYLSDRQSIVVAGGHKSKEFRAISGVPQGSHLGPIFFNIFINDVGKCINNSKFLMFADDLKIYRIVNSSEDAALLQSDLCNLVLWCRANGMSLNPSKCHVVRFSRKKNVPYRVYHINQEPLNEVSHTRDLGVILDSKLRFNLHIDNVATKAFKMLGFILRICKDFKNPITKITIFSCLVRSILEYCSTVWNPHYSVYIKRLESVQKRFLWHLTYSCNLGHRLSNYKDRLLHFNIKSLRHRRELLDIMFLYKLINGNLDTPDLLSRINIYVPKQLQRLKKPPFTIDTSKTNLGYYAPINRSLRSYNLIHNANTNDPEPHTNKGYLDIFSNSQCKFKQNVSQVIGE